MINVLKVLNYTPNQNIGLVFVFIVGYLFWNEMRKPRALLSYNKSILLLISSALLLVYFGTNKSDIGYSIGMIIFVSLLSFAGASYIKSSSYIEKE